MTRAPERVVELTGVHKRFGPGVHALDDVSLTVHAGEVVVLLGASGSGKSTLLRHVNGLHQPSAGVVRVLGTDVAAAGGAALRRLRQRVGMVFQQFHLVGGLTVLENVCTGAFGTLRGPRLGLPTYPRRVRAAALEQLDRVGSPTSASSRHPLRRAAAAGGRGQGAAAAAPDPARRPVASLDPESAAQVLQLIATLAWQDRLTVLCSLHQVDLALELGERVVGLRSGRVVLDRPVAGLDRDAAMAVYPARSPEAVPVLAR